MTMQPASHHAISITPPRAGIPAFLIEAWSHAPHNGPPPQRVKVEAWLAMPARTRQRLRQFSSSSWHAWLWVATAAATFLFLPGWFETALIAIGVEANMSTSLALVVNTMISFILFPIILVGEGYLSRITRGPLSDMYHLPGLRERPDFPMSRFSSAVRERIHSTMMGGSVEYFLDGVRRDLGEADARAVMLALVLPDDPEALRGGQRDELMARAVQTIG